MKENSIEEDIELLQDETNFLGLFFKCKGSEKYKIALEHILSDYKRVLKENEELKYKYNKALSDVIAGVDLDNTYISKQKVKDKIEELNKKEQELQNSVSNEEREEYSDANISWNLMDVEIRREVLQELLEGEK